MSIINEEALKERARKLYTVPTELTQAEVAAMTGACLATITSTQPVLSPHYVQNGNLFVLNVAVSALTPAERFQILECLNRPNGIKLVLVAVSGAQAKLEVHFFNKNYLNRFIAEAMSDPTAPARMFPLSGGHRLPAGQATGQVRVVGVAVHADADKAALVLTIEPIGDYSTYTLSINTSAFAGEPIVIDPMFNDINFKFRPGCFSSNCAPDWETHQAPQQQPVINYLAKDFDSFRHTMIAAMMERVPGWQPTSEADLDQVLLELFSASADELSDYQDRVMNEAYLSTARKRVSLARHARLMDYHIHQGNQASTWLAMKFDFQSAPPANQEYHLTEKFPLWSGDSENPFSPNAAQDSSAIIFTTRDTLFVHPLLNQMSLYTWSDSIPSLAAGSTTADLKLFFGDGTPANDHASALTVQDLIREGKLKHLLIQQWLNPATGRRGGRDPNKRQLLRLVSGIQGAEALHDPLTGAMPATAEWFVRVRWREEDKLKSNYCFTIECEENKIENVSLFHGHLVEAHHGRPMNAVFKEPGTLIANAREFYYERTRWGTLCVLPENSLAYRDTTPGGDVPPRSTLALTVSLPGGGDDVWDEVPSLIHSDTSDENGDHFVVETDEEAQSVIRFGNGTSAKGGNGKELPENAVVRCEYQIGRGLDGNVGADKVSNFDAKIPSIFIPQPDGTRHFLTTAQASVVGCWNPFDVTGGRAPEPAAEIVRRVPEAYRQRQLRAVTLQDYVNRAQELAEVSRASARYAWTGSWRTVQMTIDPVSTTRLDDALRQKLARHLDAVRLIGEDLEIRPPRFVPLDIRVTICVHPDFWPEDVRLALEQEFSDGWTPDGRMGFFHPDSWTFGQSLHASQIVGRVQRIEGVEHVINVKLGRWNEVMPNAGDEIANLRPNEIIQVLNDPDHMENGFIGFEVRGGRQ